MCILRNCFNQVLVFQMGIHGIIVILNEWNAVLYTSCDDECSVPDERRVSIWIRPGHKPNNMTIAALNDICILDVDMSTRTGESECW